MVECDGADQQGRDRPEGDEVTDDGANAALPSPPALFPKHDEAVPSAPALSRQHGTATEHAASKGFRLALNPAASSEIAISQRVDVAVPNQQPNATRAPAWNERCHVRLSRSPRVSNPSRLAAVGAAR